MTATLGVGHWHLKPDGDHRLGTDSAGNDFDCEQRALERDVQALPPHKRLDFLADWRSPAKHPTASGGWATRYFKQALQQRVLAS